MLAGEQERFIRSAIAQLVGAVARHELPGNQWPALLEFLSQTMLAENLPDKEVGDVSVWENEVFGFDALRFQLVKAFAS